MLYVKIELCSMINNRQVASALSYITGRFNDLKQHRQQSLTDNSKLLLKPATLF